MAYNKAHNIILVRIQKSSQLHHYRDDLYKAHNILFVIVNTLIVYDLCHFSSIIEIRILLYTRDADAHPYSAD